MLITVSCTGYQTENSRVYTSIYIFMTVTHGKGGLQNEENLSAEEAPQNEGAWISQENVYSQWPQGACPPPRPWPQGSLCVKELYAHKRWGYGAQARLEKGQARRRLGGLKKTLQFTMRQGGDQFPRPAERDS